MYGGQCLGSVEDADDVKAAERVEAELRLLSEVSGQSEPIHLPPSRRHVHSTSTDTALSQVAYSLYSDHVLCLVGC